ncbi:AbrB/MazE/SpoVT family DNA-binding domain-containing protein (plasmid) [Planococcus maritimus]|uniref:AbrB/MazE/SpoVT family DNA-binding domain-containing protein n=1 Tax=Planococcus TaxID=1372 RepID=UPI001B8CFA4D|nr:AbrB/MazE/SpoVT family DNA-binding domain-containing protein [Planococcus sp. MSAK28401]
MKSTLVTRKVSHLGHIMIPISQRKTLNISVGDELEIFIENEKIIMKKHLNKESCVITGALIDKETDLNYSNSISLSSAGAAILLKELQDYNREE